MLDSITAVLPSIVRGLSGFLTLDVILYLLAHLLIVTFNMSVIIAFFDRLDLLEEPDKWEKRKLYVRAFLASALGILSTLSIFKHTDWPKYGMKLWFGEFPSDSNMWFKRMIDTRDAANLYNIKHYVDTKAILGGSEGRCDSIWGTF